MKDEPRIFSTDKGAVVIKSDVKNKIIGLLEKREMSGSEIREELDRAKSTVSVHLSDLKDLDVIQERPDPDDERKKIFTLKSKFLGKSEIPYDKHYRDILKNVREAQGDEYEFIKSLFHLIRYGLISFGLDIHPALKEIGRDAGRSMGKSFSGNDREEVIEEIKGLWKSTGLGKIEVEGEYLTIQDCFDCGDMPDVNHTLCSLDEGIIEGIFEESLGEKISVEEVECHGTGEGHCKFRME